MDFKIINGYKGNQNLKKNHFDEKRKNIVVIDAELLGKTTSNKSNIISSKGIIYIIFVV